ncbi:MAG: phosphotransferase [Magnetococcales bacterium]|nr:phosphotransferase [Magnetococcales bacterium]MBF0115175.1 phosphotransferase [Magnetococcales bacterium]
MNALTIDSMPVLRVVFLDDEPDQLDLYAPILKGIISSLGYSVDITLLKDPVEFEKRLKSERPHVAVCDIQLNPTALADPMGLVLIARNKGAYPDVVFIGLTRVHVDYRQLCIRIPNPDLLLSKEDIMHGDEDQMNIIKDILASRIKRNPSCQYEIVSKDGDVFSQYGSPKPSRQEIQSLIEQVTFTCPKFNSRARIRRIVLNPLTGGFSGSAVFEMRASNELGELSVVGVLKISRIGSHADESVNYKQFVRWFLPFRWRVDLLGEGVVKDHGAICYSFVTLGRDCALTLTYSIKNGNTENIERVINAMFDHNSKSWYSQVVRVEKGIQIYYQGKPFFNSPKQKEDAYGQLEGILRYVCRRSGVSFESHNDEYVVGNNKYISPRKLIFTSEWGFYHKCICHGDLNSNNIMIDKDATNLVFIDFQKTGFSHVFSDFIVFESSVRMHYPDLNVYERSIEKYIHVEFDQFMRGFSEIDKQDSALDEYLLCIRKIRYSAYMNFPDEPFNNYVIGTIIFNWRLLSVENLNELQKFRMSSVVIAGLKYLNSKK